MLARRRLDWNPFASALQGGALSQTDAKRSGLSCTVLRHVEIEDLGYLGEALEAAGVNFGYIDAETLTQAEPPLAEALIVLGGPISAYDTDDHPYLAREIELIRKHLRARRPVLGVCLGAQLLAAAAGARVYRGTRGKEIGWASVQLTEAGRADPIWHGFPAEFTTFHWHGDTFDVPPAAELLASSASYVQAFRIASHAYGVQFHPEVVPAQLADWIIAYQLELERERLDSQAVLGVPDAAAHRRLALRFGQNLARWMHDTAFSNR